MPKRIPKEIGTMKKSLSILCILAITIGFAASSDASVPSVGDPGRTWSVPNDGQVGEHVQQFLDTFPGEAGSELMPTSRHQPFSEENPTCASWNEAKCYYSEIRYQAVVPFCTDDNDVNCTVNMGVIDASGNKISASFNRYFPTKARNQYEGNTEYKLPSGVAGSIFSLPQVPHDGGDKYYLSVVMNGSGSISSGIGLSDFSVKLYPVKLEADSSLNDMGDTGWAILPAGTPGNPTGKDNWQRFGPGFSGNNFCVATSGVERLCAQRYAFPSGYRFYVSVRTQQLPSGWMHGRLSEPDIKITKDDAYSTIEITAEPVAVPIIYKMYKYPDMPTELKALYDVKTGAYVKDPNFVRFGSRADFAQGGRTSGNPDPLLRNVIVAPEAFSAAGMEQIKAWLPFVGDKATALLSYWSVRTLSQEEMQGSSACFADKSNVTGIVTTNSTQYSGGPPKFSKSEGTLDYQVAAPHLGTDSSVFKGSYDLVMRSDVARCIYGFSKAPINATLSITSSDGTPQIATTVIGERNGWLYLRAKNFEFSAPIIKAKFTQEAEVAAVAPALPAKVSVKKTTITCAKGKKVQRVYGVKPKCPTGYKKR
jgi:hypothetical protein